MDTGRNDLLGEIAADAALERSDFLVQSTDQLRRFLDRHKERIAAYGGLTLIDEEPDYLSIAPDGTFRSRTRFLDDLTGEWVSETEVIETARRAGRALQPGRHLRRVQRGGQARRPVWSEEPTATDDLLEAAGISPEETIGLGEDPYAAAADSWAAGQPADGRARRRRGGSAAPVRPCARVPGTQPAQRVAPARRVRAGGRTGIEPARGAGDRRRRRRAPRPDRRPASSGPRSSPRRPTGSGGASQAPTSSSSSTTRPTSSATWPMPSPRRIRRSRRSSPTPRMARRRGCRSDVDAGRRCGRRHRRRGRRRRRGHRGQDEDGRPEGRPTA